MKGRVFFWYKLDSRTGKGSVMFRLYGQQCRTCKNGKFEHAMWYPEEVVKVRTTFKQDSGIENVACLTDFTKLFNTILSAIIRNV